MKLSLLAAFALLATIAVTAGPFRGGDDDEAPPLQFELVINGVAHAAEEGRPFEFEIDNRKVKAAIRVKPTRRFAANGVSFDFPRGLEYEFEGEDGLTTYTLSGGSALVMLQMFEAGDAQAYAKTILEETLAAMEEDSRPQAHGLLLGGATLPALRGVHDDGDIQMNWITCGIDVGSRPVVLFLQDMLDDDGTASAEMEQILQLLGKTFRHQ